MRTLLRLAVVLATIAAWSAPAALAQNQNIDDPGAIGSEVTITLTNGDTLTGVLLENTGIDIVLDHPLLGQIPISKTLIVLDEPEVVAPVAEEVEVVSPWSGRVDGALEGSSGNVREHKYNFTLNIRREVERTIDTLYATYAKERNYQTKKPLPGGGEGARTGTTTKDEFFVRVRREWKLKQSDWMPFVQATGTWDEFRNFNYRWSASAGAGYRIIDEATEKLIGRVGLGFNQKVGADDEDDLVTEILVGAEYQIDFTDTNHLVIDSTVWPAVKNDAGDYRTFTVGEWRLDLAEGSPWYFKFGADHEYDSNPDADDSNEDFNYYAGIGATF